MRKELLIGCGVNRDKRLFVHPHVEWEGLVTLDINPDCKPDILWNLSIQRRLPFEDSSVDEIHAYDVLEHVGYQGDFEGFFSEFTEYHRILKPQGLLFATVPPHGHLWVWGDPGHRRTINEGTLFFLSQRSYDAVGTTKMADYRHWYKADFEKIYSSILADEFRFILRAVK